jgi:regulator of replication initiation timing
LHAAEQGEQRSLAQLAEAEAAWQGKAAAAEAELRAQRDALQAERDQLSQQIGQSQAECSSLREQNASLSLAAHAAQDELVRAHAQSQTATEALGAAEAGSAERDRLAQENAELREERAWAEREVKALAGRGDEAKDARVELAAAQAKLAELARLLEENQKLRDEVADLRMHQEASGELERLTAEHKRLRLDAELMARRLQELLQEQTELTSLRGQAADAAALTEEVVYLRRREQDLEAQIYAKGFRMSREMPAIADQLPAQTPISDMETNLHLLLNPSGPRTAVLADAQGFLIASAGQSVAQEGLAAFAAVAGDMAARARMLLPLAGVESVRVTDANSMVLTCHLFECEKQGLGLATLGAGEPTHENTAQAIVGLVANLSSRESDPET